MFDKAIISITSNCNLDCDYCYISNKYISNELTTKEWKKIFIKISDQGVKHVQLTGGEPFMRNDILEILKLCNDKFRRIILTTNAILIGEEESISISKLKNVITYISLNTIDENTSSKLEKKLNSRKIEGIYQLKQREIPVIISTTVTKENFIHLPKIKNYVEEMDLGWRLGHIILRGKADINMLDPISLNFLNQLTTNSYNKKLRKISVIPSCSAGFSSFSIIENGNILPCIVARDSCFISGNILKDDFEKIYNSKGFRKWRDEICMVNETCKNCKNFDVCKGGCPMRTLSFREKIDNNIPYDICSCAWFNYVNELNLDKNFKGRSY